MLLKSSRHGQAAMSAMGFHAHGQQEVADSPPPNPLHRPQVAGSAGGADAALRLDQQVQTSYGSGPFGSDEKTTTDPAYNALGEEVRRTTTATLLLAGVEPATATVTRGYDAAGYVDTVEQTGSSPYTIDYDYSAVGRLLSRTASGAGAASRGTRLYFYWATSGARAEEVDADGTTVTRHLVDSSLRQVAEQRFNAGVDGEADTTDGGKWVWDLRDIDNNVATVLQDNGDVAQQKAFDPYGKPLTQGTQDQADPDGVGSDWAPGSSLGFDGAPTDDTTGNVILGGRQYDPTTQRFTVADTFVAAGLDMQLATDPLTGNRYLFAAANPVAYSDDGHAPGEGLLETVVKEAVDIAYDQILGPVNLGTRGCAPTPASGLASVPKPRGALCKIEPPRVRWRLWPRNPGRFTVQQDYGPRMGLRSRLRQHLDRAASLDDWLHDYNHHRPHTSLSGRSPVDELVNHVPRQAI